MPSPFVPFDTQYSAHIHASNPHPTTGEVFITVAFHPDNRGNFNCKIWKLAPPYTGQPILIRDWVQGQYSVGPFGHGASVPLPTGALLTVVPVAADSNEVEPSRYVDPGVCAPYALGGAGAPGPAGPQGIPGPPGPQGEPGSGGGAGLTPRQAKALDWLVWILGPLLNP